MGSCRWLAMGVAKREASSYQDAYVAKRWGLNSHRHSEGTYMFTCFLCSFASLGLLCFLPCCCVLDASLTLHLVYNQFSYRLCSSACCSCAYRCWPGTCDLGASSEQLLGYDATMQHAFILVSCIHIPLRNVCLPAATSSKKRSAPPCLRATHWASCL
jgi:hypothetical protein